MTNTLQARLRAHARSLAATDPMRAQHDAGVRMLYEAADRIDALEGHVPAKPTTLGDLVGRVLVPPHAQPR